MKEAVANGVFWEYFPSIEFTILLFIQSSRCKVDEPAQTPYS